MPWTLHDQNDEIAVDRSTATGFGSAGQGAVIYEPVRDELWCSRGVSGSPVRRVNPETLEVVGDISGSSLGQFQAAAMGDGFCWISGQTGTGQFVRIEVLTLTESAVISAEARRNPIIFGGALYNERTPGSIATIHRSILATGADFDPAQNTGTIGRSLAGGGVSLTGVSSPIVWTNPGTVVGQDGEFVLLNAAAMTVTTRFVTLNTNDENLALRLVATRPGSGIFWTGNRDAFYGWNINNGDFITHTDISSAGDGATMMVIYVPAADAILTLRTTSSTRIFQMRHPISGELISELVSTAPAPAWNIQAKSWGIRGTDVYFLGQTSRIFRVGLPEAPTDDCAVPLEDLVRDLLVRSGVPPHRIGPLELEGSVDGFGLGRAASARQAIEILQAAYFFDVIDYRGRIAAVMRGRDIQSEDTIPEIWLSAAERSEADATRARRTRVEEFEIPREVRIQYLQRENEFEPGVQVFDRRVTESRGVLDVDLTALSMTADQAAGVAEVTMLEQIINREGVEFTLAHVPETAQFQPGDLRRLEIGGRSETVRLLQLDYAWPGLQTWTATRHDSAIYQTDARGVATRRPSNAISWLGPTELELLDAPLVRLFDDAPGYFAAMGGNPTIPGVLEGWSGADLQRLGDVEFDEILRIRRPGSVFGELISQPTAAQPVTVRAPGVLLIETQGPLFSITIEALLAGQNTAALEVRDSSGDRIGWEILQFNHADWVTDQRRFELSGLLRGRFGTEWAVDLHQTGDRFVLLAGLGQLAEEIDQVGSSWNHRAVTFGQDPEDADQVSFTWQGVDRIPYAPASVRAQRDNQDVIFTWFRRDRIGNELRGGSDLTLSETEERYRLRLYDGATVVVEVEVTDPLYVYTDEVPDFGSQQTEFDIEVRQLGELDWGYANRDTVSVQED